MAIKNSFLKELRYAHDLQDYESVWGLVVCNWNWDDLKFLRNRFSRIICDSINDDGIRRVGRGFRNLGDLLPIQLHLSFQVDRLNYNKKFTDSTSWSSEDARADATMPTTGGLVLE